VESAWKFKKRLASNEVQQERPTATIEEENTQTSITEEEENQTKQNDENKFKKIEKTQKKKQENNEINMNQKDTVNRYVDRSLIMFDQQMNEELDIYKIRTQNKHKIIFGQLNVNSLRNKFTVLSQIIKNTDVFLVSETKLDQSFPTAQFEIPGFATPYRLDSMYTMIFLQN